MSASLKRTRSFDDGDEFKSVKKNPTKENNYCNISMKLMNTLNSLISLKLVTSNNLNHVFKQLSDKIPRIVVWGSQSSGKSTVLNNMFGLPDELKLEAHEGMATKCPVEIRLGPQYEDSVYVKFNDKLTKINSFQDAQKEARNLKSLIYAKIIIEKKNTSVNMIIVDIPGCIADETNNIYMNVLYGEYLTKPNTTILHVMKAMDDPETDISAKYLSGLDANVIKVLTHTDICDKTGYIDRYIKNGYKVALVNNKKDECKFIDNLKVNGEYINGCVALRDTSMELLENATKKSIPDIRVLVNKSYQVLNTEFEKIGRTKPNERDVVYELQRYLRMITKKQFEDRGTSYAKEWNMNRDTMTKEVIHEYHKLIPSIKTLADELKTGSRRSFKGSEGWDFLVKTNIKNIINELQKKIVVHITNMMEITHKYCISCVDGKYNEYTVKIQDKLKSMVSENCRKLTSELIQKVNSYLDTLASNPFDDSEYFVKILNDQMMRESNNLIKKCIELQTSSRSIKDNLDELKQMIIQRKFKDSYTPKAQTAHRQLKSFWKSKSGEIHNTLNSYLGEYDEKIQDMCNELIDRIDYADVIESAELDRKRNAMIKLEDDLNELRIMLA